MERDERETKTCKSCFEQIDRRARACPHCGAWQPAGMLRLWLPVVVIMGFGILWSEWLAWRLREGPAPGDVVQYRGQIAVTESEMLLGDSQDGPTVSVVGRLQNRSDVTWGQINMEVEFLDPDGKLIDVDVERHYLERILPHGEMAFKLSTVADRAVGEYASYRVYVRFAEEAAEWPW